MPAQTAAPLISVVMANFNGASYLAEAVGSALAQSAAPLADPAAPLPGWGVEVLVADDASTDGSVALAEALAARDPRVRVLPAAANAGPGAARNRALAAARGTWIAVMDSDDLMHPHRLATLVAAAAGEGADIVADDVMAFDQDGLEAPRALLAEAAPRWVDLAAYVRGNALFRVDVTLGVLKPVFRRALLRDGAVRYDETLRIAEDYDLVARLLGEGARLRLHPELTYFYRKHGRSISYRLKGHHLEAMLAADAGMRALPGMDGPGVTAALDARRASLEDALAFDRLTLAIKAGRAGEAVRLAAASPRAALLLRQPVAARVAFARRWLRARAAATEPAALPPAPRGMAPGARPRPGDPAPGGRHVCLVSRQRITGNANGSSAYLLSMVAAIRAEGHAVHLVCPSPAVFGRWPALRLGPEMDVFASVRIRGAWRLGRWWVARDPRVALAAGLGVADRLLRRVGIGALSGLARPAAYAIGVPWTRADRLFVARHARPRADALLLDYAFLTEAIPYALRPDAPSAVVMHDLFSDRAAQFARLGGADSVSGLDRATEMALLARAGTVVAIQAEEGAAVRAALPDHPVVVAPMAVAPASAPRPGRGATVLFVGSAAAPNVDGLRWCLETVWPRVRAAVPEAVLSVAGTVGAALDTVPAGVERLGRVPDLDPLYESSAVVISPLRAGSGLKIKLVEALGQGKAIVATPATLQGVEADGAVAVAADAEGFADAVVALLRDPALRAERAALALAVAHRRFSPGACYAGVLAALAGPAAVAAAAPAGGEDGEPAAAWRASGWPRSAAAAG